MAYDLAKVTANGSNLIAQILANKSSLSIDKIEISDTQLSSTTDISTMTSVPKVVQTVSANGFSKNSNTLIISTVVDNSSISADYKAWVFGIWGSDSQNGQSQLIAVITSTNSPDTIPAFSGSTPVSYTYKFNIGFSNASQIQFNMIDDSFATNDTVVHTTGDETINGQKKFDTDPTDIAGNAYAKTVDVNQQLDKKVNIADMRKPASDVAGIEEVNTKVTDNKNGSINFNSKDMTPADDSKVVHSADTSNWQKQAMFNPGDFKIDYTSPTTDFATLLRSKYDKAGIVYIRDRSWPVVNAVVICEGGGWWYAYGVNSDGYFVHRKIKETEDTGWVVNADDSAVVHTADMRKPANDVAGIEEVNAKQDKISYTPADDSKVAHLSGANNFDTVPTVNNNPLLLASSLPSDLARTSQQTNFTAGLQSNGQDVLTVKTPGVPKLAVNYNVNSKAFDYTMTAPEKDGFSDIIQYNLLWKDHSVDDWKTVIVKPDDLTGQLTGVDITKTYDFKAAAQNAVGSSDFTDVITLPAASAPGIPSLTVEYDAGKKGFDYTVTAPESDGGSEITEYSLEYQKQGGTDWTKVALKPDSLTGTVTDGIESGSDYLFRVNAENAVGSSEYFTVSDPLPTVDGNIYGVSWDGSSSGALQRTDAAVGLKAGINGAQNDFDTRGPWGLMDKTVTDSYGNAFVRVPKFYIRKTQNKPLSTWQVSLVKQGDDWYLPNCFYDFDNKKELDYVDVSRYEGSIISGKLQSKTGVTPTSNVDINDFRTAATALNVDGKKGYHLWDVHTLDALQVLFTIEFATLDSQSIMEGNDGGSSAISNGTTDNVKGSSGFATRGAAPMTYRGIENLYGNLSIFTDGLNISNLSLYSCDDATKYASDVFTSPYYKLNYSLQSMTSGNSNITGLGFDKDHPSVEAPISSNNDQYNTYYHDYSYVNGSGNYVVDTGGGWNWYAGVSGLWCWSGVDSPSYAGSYFGSRLLKKSL